MKESIGSKLYNTETSTPVKYYVDTEDLGDGFTRFSTKVIYSRDKDGEYFLYVKRVTTERRCMIFDIQEYIVPVSDEWVRDFNSKTPEVYPTKSLDGRPPSR